MMNRQLKAKLLAALDAADAMYAEISEPTRNIRDQWEFFRTLHPKVKAARRALEKEG